MTARRLFVAAQGELDPSKAVFIDEAGVNAGMALNHGWAPVGVKPVVERPSRSKNITLIGAISWGGTRVLTRVEGSVDGPTFVQWLRDDLGPTLKPGDIVIMDGPRIHRVAGVAEALAEFGAKPLYLPAYSPELNPIEMAWAWLKQALRKAAPRRVARLRSLVESIWKNVTSSLCQGWIRHAGYTMAST